MSVVTMEELKAASKQAAANALSKDDANYKATLEIKKSENKNKTILVVGCVIVVAALVFVYFKYIKK